MKAELFYITDTYCIWCYGFGGVIKRIAEEYADKITVRVLNGGMIPSDMPLVEMFSRFPDPMALHERVMTTSGRTFGIPYLKEIQQFKSSKRILNSSTPARAMTAFKHLGVKDELALTSAIQDAYYIGNHDLQDIASYVTIARRFDVDYTSFKDTIGSMEAINGVMQDRQIVEQLGIQGFPALLFKSDDNRYVPLARGFTSLEDLKSKLDIALSRYAPSNAQDVDGEACGLDGKGC